MLLAALLLFAQSDVPQRQRSDTVVVAIDDMVRTAMTNNLRLRAASAQAQGAATYGLAARSRFDPILNIGGESNGAGVGGQLVGLLPTGANYLLGSISPSNLPGEPLYPDALVFSVNQPVLRGLGWYSDRKSIRGVDEGVAAAQKRLSRARDEVAAGIRIAYAVLVERHRQESIVDRSVKRAEDLRDAYTELRRLSKITEVDLITAQLGVASRRETLLEARRDRQEAEDALVFAVYGARASTMLARDNVVLMPRDTAVVLPQMSPIDQAMDAAIAARPDIAAAKHDAARTRYQSDYARNASLPTLSVVGSLMSTKFGTTNSVTGLMSESRGQDWSAGFVLSRPILNSGAGAERERAAAVQMAADVSLTEAENVVRAEVRTAYRDIELGREQSALAAHASQLARKQYDGERERLTLGLTDLFRVLQYEDQVARIERAEASAWLAYATAVAQYRLAMAQ